MKRFANTVYISLGSNLGDRQANLHRALEELSLIPQIQILRTSSMLHNRALIVEDQPDFLNQIAEISTSLDPFSLLKICMSIEEKTGRVRTMRFGPRVIDLDILIYNNVQIRTASLVLPHPGLRDRGYLHTLMKELNADHLFSVNNAGLFTASSTLSAS